MDGKKRNVASVKVIYKTASGKLFGRYRERSSRGLFIDKNEICNRFPE